MCHVTRQEAESKAASVREQREESRSVGSGVGMALEEGAGLFCSMPAEGWPPLAYMKLDEVK